MQTSVLMLRLTVLSLDRVRGIMEKDALKDPATNRSAANARLLLNEVLGELGCPSYNCFRFRVKP
jgi:hypothetical protein